MEKGVIWGHRYVKDHEFPEFHLTFIIIISVSETL